MPIPLPKYNTPYRRLVRDIRPATQRVAELMDQPNSMAMTAVIYCAVFIFYVAPGQMGGWADIIALSGYFYFRWAFHRPFHLPFRMPRTANMPVCA